MQGCHFVPGLYLLAQEIRVADRRPREVSYLFDKLFRIYRSLYAQASFAVDKLLQSAARSHDTGVPLASASATVIPKASKEESMTKTPADL